VVTDWIIRSRDVSTKMARRVPGCTPRRDCLE
jgi:hypothetical protein